MVLLNDYGHGGDVYHNRVRLDFSANVNPLGTPPEVVRAVAESAERLAAYPDPYCGALREKLAAVHGVGANDVVCGNGAAEIIFQFAAAKRPQRALLPVPSFSEYAAALDAVGCETVYFPLSRAGGFAVTEAILDAIAPGTDVLILCTPNNPTGRLIAPGLLDRVLEICAGQGTRLFLDECFLGLSEGGVSLKCRLGEYPGLFILKAYTKSYGMAGLRLGYCLTADAPLLSAMGEESQPWNVSVPAQAAGIAALKEGDFLARANAVIREERPRLKAGLEALGCWVCPSEANYLLFRGPEDLGDRLLKKGIALRSCANYHGLGPGWFRTAVRTREENDRLLAAMAGEE